MLPLFDGAGCVFFFFFLFLSQWLIWISLQMFSLSSAITREIEIPSIPRSSRPVWMSSKWSLAMNILLLSVLTMVCSSMSLAGHRYMQATEQRIQEDRVQRGIDWGQVPLLSLWGTLASLEPVSHNYQQQQQQQCWGRGVGNREQLLWHQSERER